MQEIILPRDKFQFDKFSKRILRYLRKQVSEEVDPSYAIVAVSEPGGVPRFGPEEGRENFLKELESGLKLFFPFSDSDIGEPIECADGRSRTIKENSDFRLGETSCVGFLIQLKDKKFIINSAINAGRGCPGGTESVDIAECDIFDAAMEKFIRQFVEKIINSGKNNLYEIRQLKGKSIDLSLNFGA